LLPISITCILKYLKSNFINKFLHVQKHSLECTLAISFKINLIIFQSVFRYLCFSLQMCQPILSTRESLHYLLNLGYNYIFVLWLAHHSILATCLWLEYCRVRFLELSFFRIVESTTSYTFIQCVRSYSSPGIDTRYNGFYCIVRKT